MKNSINNFPDKIQNVSYAKYIKFRHLFILVFLITGCSSKSGPVSSSDTISQNLELILDVTKITGKTLKETEAILGKSETTEKVKGYPCERSNCIRAFFNDEKIEILFKENKASRITIHDIPDYTGNDKALQVLGLPASPPAFKNPSVVSRWKNIKGFKEISFFSDYALIQVTD